MITVKSKAMVEQRRRKTPGAATTAVVGKKVGYGSKVVARKKQMKWRRQRRLRMVSPAAEIVPPVGAALQKLFLSCKEVFKGSTAVPSPGDVDRLTNILDDMKPEDVGLSKNLQFFKAPNVVKGTPRVRCATVYQCNEFSMCIFFLPATGLIPLHSHPGMTVFSKLLLGTMHIKSYDWVDPANSDFSMAKNNPHVRLAKKVADSVFTAQCNANVLYPTTGGNMHEFRAITPCAVLDVLGPPYSAKDGRDCSYYKDFPYNAFSEGETLTRTEGEESYGWLEEIAVPEESHMDPIGYLGPPVIDSP